MEKTKDNNVEDTFTATVDEDENGIHITVSHDQTGSATGCTIPKEAIKELIYELQKIKT